MKKTKSTFLATLALTFFISQQSLSDNIIDETLKCAGTEPFWGMTLEVSSWQDSANSAVQRVAQSAVFSNYDLTSPIRYSAEQLKLQTSRNDLSVYSVAADATATSPNLTAVIDFHLQQEGSCNDGMSDLAYPYSIFVVFGAQTLSGCCQSNLYPAK